MYHFATKVAGNYCYKSKEMALKFAYFTGGISLNRHGESLHLINLRSSTNGKGLLVLLLFRNTDTLKPWRMRWRKGKESRRRRGHYKRARNNAAWKSSQKLAVNTKRTGCAPTGAGGLRCHYFGTPARFGNMSDQMRTFTDQTGGLYGHPARYTASSAACSVLPERGGGRGQTITSTSGLRLPIMGW